VAHGTQDPVVGLALGEQAVDWLQQHAYPVEWHQYPMQHQVCWEQIQQIGGWLRQVLR
jgi:phospholipase/carboxylesterase